MSCRRCLLCRGVGGRESNVLLLLDILGKLAQGLTMLEQLHCAAPRISYRFALPLLMWQCLYSFGCHGVAGATLAVLGRYSSNHLCICVLGCFSLGRADQPIYIPENECCASASGRVIGAGSPSHRRLERGDEPLGGLSISSDASQGRQGGACINRGCAAPPARQHGANGHWFVHQSQSKAEIFVVFTVILFCFCSR